MQAIRQEDEFKLFFEVIFPASDLGLKDYRDTALLRIQRLTGKDAEVIIQIYKRFKGLIWLKSDLGTKDYNKAETISPSGADSGRSLSDRPDAF
ncbi:hypothetical protein [Bathymodiolus platifrons methanotrophic gill symbiont]|uniref:hypothetical protein n=1 Tax=Bathymodiolus platifrons methanotrophic gill symbiont TaxID=113268 RepID=UPI001C8ED47F|nr:hypothetical protein [Bathymodiolus platifrons methanotrophic gill symbiont]